MVIIAGGGIGGLTTAVALQRAGFAAEVFEAAPELRAVGAGIWVPPNAMAVLHELGLADDVRAAGMPLRTVEVSDARGAVLSSMDMDAIAGELGHATVAIRRSELQRILAGALQPGTLHTGRSFSAYSVDGDVVTASFEAGDDVSGSLLVGADGVHSAVRLQLFPDARVRYSGQTCYRGLASLELGESTLRQGREVWGGRVRFGFSAVDPRTVYWFAPVTAPAGEPPPAGLQAWLLDAYASFPDPVRRIIQATSESSILQTDLHDLAPLHRWSRGPVGLLGDAAHATTPNLGQGGAQAVEDALALARRIVSVGATPAALDAFWQARHRRTGRIVAMSRTFGRLAHWTSPVTRSLRNAALRATPAGVQRRQVMDLFTPVL